MGRGNVVALIVFGIIILVFPLVFTNPYYLRVMNFAGIFAIICIGLSLLLGYAGQISIGQAGFFAIGAYTSGILTAKFGFNVWSGIFIGIGINCVVAVIVGIPTLKLRGHYLAMATLGIGEIIHIVALADMEDFTKLWRSLGEALGYNPSALAAAVQPYAGLTGGPSGFAGIPTLSLGPWEATTPEQWFYITWGVVFVFLVLALNLIHSRIGRALRAIHGNEEAARAMGVNTPPLKVGVFVVSAAMASVAGSLYAHYVKFISPESFSINESIHFVVMVAVGGMMNVWGAVVGTIIMTILPESLRFFHDYDILMYGLVLLLIMMFMPEGVVGLAQRLYASTKSKRSG
jgi:branched-chain amino acid transport system permease protein